MSRVAKRRLILILVSVGVLYLGDSLWLRHRMAQGWNPIGTSTIHRYYAIAEKNNQVEYMNDGDDTQECVHALFPHMGDSPCWSQSNKKEERIDE